MKKHLLLGILAAGSLVASVRAQTIVYAVEFNQSNNRFGTLNLLNGSFTQISSLGGTLINDIACRPSDGALYGLLNNGANLVTFDETNGAMTIIAALSVSGIQSIAFRSSDGVLFGATQSSLYTINTTNGQTTLIGNFGGAYNLGGSGQNIRFAQDGNLYISNTSADTDIYRVNTVNGTALWVGEVTGFPNLILENGGDYIYGVSIAVGAPGGTAPELLGFDLSNFVDGGTNADGSTHQITVKMVGACTNFPVNFNFSGNVLQPIVDPSQPVSAVGPVDQTSCPESTVIFSTTASGTGPFSYVWLKNDAVIDGETSSSLTLNNISASDAATYSVIVSGAIGSVTNSATLRVNTAPVLPLQGNHEINMPITLIVTNTASDLDVPIQTLTYALVNPPAGAAIDDNGVITWTITSAQNSSTNVITTVATDNGVPALSATNSFIVTIQPNKPQIITSIIHHAGGMEVAFSATPNFTYLVQATTNLAAPQWITISTNTAGPDGTWSILDLDATNHPVRFYRSSTTPFF